MLSYQHGYHAGGPADVHKHAALARMLDKVARERMPCTYVETHAGRGLYSLNSPEARKTGEAERGILARLREGAKLPEPYRRAIRMTRAAYGPNAYPGSPMIARLILRPIDHLHLMELHPQEFAALRQSVAGPGIRVLRQDGLDAALALLPPRQGSGFLFIDPSYEVKAEYAAVASFVQKVIARWPDARLLLWYPILEQGLHELMIEKLERMRLPGHEHDRVYFPAEISPRLRGSGLIGLNMPQDLSM
ncbi:23S rRNA (adenine(2030)-N(6))-methyltransferase RlmJ [Rhodoligotrophos defluvii]|uniref:23S rRNA (adenine(2030)-N(6))-methyltransferase RlmJ n=1 Tax=Rhodoligotrophos defluvii TaxID=2561934 RepID=UPI0010C97158|nr:23S rRNA (adenine(2030)-N(6))-methyltransferase RlmJ [Rhodoligotrophos defluvii]